MYGALCVTTMAHAAALLACAATGERPRLVKAELTADQLVKASVWYTGFAILFAVGAVGGFALQALNL